MPSTVTLVHGTWAGSAEWIDPTSPLTQKLKARFGDDFVVFPFRWSGKNRHSERISWSRELARMTIPVAVHVPMSPATGLTGGSL